MVFICYNNMMFVQGTKYWILKARGCLKVAQNNTMNGIYLTFKIRYTDANSIQTNVIN
jgi:hypothetical protein